MFTIDHVAKPLPNAAQTLEDPHFEEPESQQPFFDCITQVCHQHICLYARQLEGYSDEAHYSAVMAAIQYSEKIHETDEFSPDFEGKDDDSFSLHRNPTKTPIILKNFLRVLPHCPIIHWASQMWDDPRLCFCPCSKHFSSWRDNNNIFIHHDHGCMVGLMTPQELLRHLRSEGDATHTAISIYLEKLKTFSQGNVRQDPSVNYRKKPHSEKEEKEEEEQEEEEEVATELDGNDVSHEHVDMNACDHSKQGLEIQIASENHNDPESEVKDGCESSKNGPDDIDKDVTDVIGSMKVMDESGHSQNDFSHNYIDMNANDQFQHQPEPEIGTENPNGPESEGTDGGDTSINVYQATMLELMLFLFLMVQDQRKLWVAVSIPKMNLPTRIMI